MILFLLLPILTNAASNEYKSDMGGAQACRGDCGTKDTLSKFTAVVRLCIVQKGEDPNNELCSGSTATMIENDIVASEAHVIGYTPEESVWSACCDAPGANNAAVCTFDSKSQSRDLRERDVYIADGSDTTTQAKTKIIGKITKFAARSTGNPPGYDIFVGHVDRACKFCLAADLQPTITPIPLANTYPAQNAAATHVFTAGTGDTDPIDPAWLGRNYAYRQTSPHVLNNLIGTPYKKTQTCRRQSVSMNGENGNPVAVADTSGSPVFITQCNTQVLHGFHGNGEGGWCSESDNSKNGKEYLCEVLQLVQNQKQWISLKIKEWTGRDEMLDACSKTGTIQITGATFDVTQYECRTDSEMVKDDGGSFFGSINVCEDKGYVVTGKARDSFNLSIWFGLIVGSVVAMVGL